MQAGHARKKTRANPRCVEILRRRWQIMGTRLTRVPSECTLEPGAHTLLRAALKDWNDVSAFTDDRVLQAHIPQPVLPVSPPRLLI